MALNTKRKSKTATSRKKTSSPAAKKKLAATLERLLARKVQIKAELAEIEEAARFFFYGVETTTQRIKGAKARKASDKEFTERMWALQRLEGELRGELFEISALTRSLPARRLKPVVSEERIRKHILDAGLGSLTGKLQDAFRTGDCVTACEVCVTSCNSECIACSECVTSCASECTTHCDTSCMACPTICQVGCMSGCSSDVAYGRTHLVDRKEKIRTMEDVLQSVVKHQGRPENIEIDWD